MNHDEYLNNLIRMSQDLTRQLEEVEAQIQAHENGLEGEFVAPDGLGAGSLSPEWHERDSVRMSA
jgi:hypothetical protein